jgi:hypothetical protein
MQAALAQDMPSATAPAPYAFVPPSASDARSPCPALNTLANHGYMYASPASSSPSLSSRSWRSHDGRNLTLAQLVFALQAGYNVSAPLAYFLSLTGLLFCGRGWPWARTLDLTELARHDALEHDASLVHADAAPGARYAPIPVDPRLLEAFHASFPEEGADRAGLVHYRARREIALGNPFQALRQRHFRLVASAESMSALDRMQDPSTGRMSHSRIAVC